MKVIWFCLQKTISGSYLKQNNSDLVFQTRTILLKMSKFVAGHVTKVWFLKLWITSFWTEILHLNFKEIVEKIMVVAFTAHLSVTIERLTRYKQKEVLAAMLEGKGVPSNMVAIALHYFVEKSKCHKISPLNLFPLKFWV